MVDPMRLHDVTLAAFQDELTQIGIEKDAGLGDLMRQISEGVRKRQEGLHDALLKSYVKSKVEAENPPNTGKVGDRVTHVIKALPSKIVDTGVAIGSSDPSDPSAGIVINKILGR